jgi:tRNA pseudouridine55 synthase
MLKSSSKKINPILNVYKPVGKTPLQVVNYLKERHPEYKNKKISYAGRLDPMAEGVLVLLVEKENKKRKLYEKLDKTYKFNVLLGASTDSYDILGIINSFSFKKTFNLSKKIKKILPLFKGVKTQAYPPFSSAVYKGRPLYWWARKKRLSEVKIPSKKIIIYSLKLNNIKSLKTSNLKKDIFKKIGLVKGDFRQEKILVKWQDFFKTCPLKTFQVISLTVKCSSGTYIRSLAVEIGKKLNTPSLCLTIKRNRVGEFKLKNSLII